MKTMLTEEAVQAALALPDLSDWTVHHPHAIGLLAQSIVEGLPPRDWPNLDVLTGPRIVSQAENYGLLGYHTDEITLGSAHTRWMSDATLLRTQTTSLIPKALQELAKKRVPGQQLGLVAPGITYRRDNRDRWHCGEPHQMDVWILMDAGASDETALLRLVADILAIALPGQTWQTEASPHHYTEAGREIQVLGEGRAIEIMECGLIAASLLERLGIDPREHRGLALGMGLDRLTMLRKGLPDIRLLRDPEPRIARQMNDLEPWAPVSRQPSTWRDMSIAIAVGCTEEALTERILLAAGTRQDWVEAIELKGRWSYSSLPENIRQRLGLQAHQENLLLRVVLRDWSGAIPRDDANALYDRIYAAVHQGSNGAGYHRTTFPGTAS
jgi:phenylalanyl-tRNA synthetase alpha chain